MFPPAPSSALAPPLVDNSAAGGKARRADMVEIDAVAIGIRAQPPHGGLAILNRGRELRLTGESIADRRGHEAARRYCPPSAVRDVQSGFSVRRRSLADSTSGFLPWTVEQEPWQPLLLSRRKHRGTAPIRLQLQRHSSARRRRILPALDTRHADAHHQRDVHHRHYLPEELDGHATTDDRVRRGRCCVHAPHYGAITQLDSDASQRGVAKETGLRASYYLIATYYVAARPL